MYLTENFISRFRPGARKYQAGAITLFSAVLIMILLTEMIIYAVQTGVFEQRKSGNEMRNKLAFHAADAGIQQAKQFMQANAKQVSSDSASVGGRSGWLSGGGIRWQPCSAISASDPTHPCFGEPVAALRSGSYFYSVGGSNELPLDPGALVTSANETVATHALLCMLDIDRSDPVKVVQGCTTDPSKQDDRYFMVTLLARGQADCDNNGANCSATSLVSEKIGSFGPGGGKGGPGAPLTARTSVPLSGTVEVVPNPNGGGIGVPVSSWVNANTTDPACDLGGEVAISPDSGSYATCEAHEWYGVGEFPSDYKCPSANCSCSKNDDRLLSFAQGQNRVLGIDIVADANFPCDLWEFMFGHPKAEYEQVLAERVPPQNRLTSCDSLNAESAGVYWISGSDCRLPGQVGTPEEPVFIISATATTRVSAQSDIFGVLFVTDVLNPAAQFSGNGGATVYGAVIMDALMKHFNGTFQIVYVENILEQVLDDGSFGAVAGGWTDFHATWQ